MRALLIFAKNLILGKVKTRLARVIGDQQALDIYRILYNRTVLTSKNVDAHKIIVYSDFVPSEERVGYERQVQQGNDLGDRMHHAFRNAFNERFDHVIIIGTDCYQLTTHILEEAFDKLETHDVVIGPANDGGYYLIGLKDPFPELFLHMMWSTPSVFTETRQRISRSGRSLFELPRLSDVDEVSDLHQLLTVSHD